MMIRVRDLKEIAVRVIKFSKVFEIINDDYHKNDLLNIKMILIIKNSRLIRLTFL